MLPGCRSQHTPNSGSRAEGDPKPRSQATVPGHGPRPQQATVTSTPSRPGSCPVEATSCGRHACPEKCVRGARISCTEMQPSRTCTHRFAQTHTVHTLKQLHAHKHTHAWTQHSHTQAHTSECSRTHRPVHIHACAHFQCACSEHARTQIQTHPCTYFKWTHTENMHKQAMHFPKCTHVYTLKTCNTSAHTTRACTHKHMLCQALAHTKHAHTRPQACVFTRPRLHSRALRLRHSLHACSFLRH